MESELSQIIEECVSFIGVDVNLADIHLLSRVSGLTMARAQAIIARVFILSDENFDIHFPCKFILTYGNPNDSSPSEKRRNFEPVRNFKNQRNWTKIV